MDNPTLLVILGVVVVIAAVGGFLVWRRRQGGGDDSFYHFRCPKCRRRLRFQARQVGHKGRCSNCGGPVIFPPVSHSTE